MTSGIDRLRGFVGKIEPHRTGWESIPRGLSKIKFLGEPEAPRSYEYRGKTRAHILIKGMFFESKDTQAKRTGRLVIIGLPWLSAKSLLWYLSQHPEAGNNLKDRIFLCHNRNNRSYEWSEDLNPVEEDLSNDEKPFEGSLR